MERCCWSPYCAVSPAAPAWSLEIDSDDGIYRRHTALCGSHEELGKPPYMTQNDAPKNRIPKEKGPLSERGPVNRAKGIANGSWRPVHR